MVGLARAAGFKAAPVMVVSRRTSAFLKDYPNYDQFNGLIVEVVLPDFQVVFLDPETNFCPYGLLPWNESEAGALVISTDSALIGSTPANRSQDAVTQNDRRL